MSRHKSIAMYLNVSAIRPIRLFVVLNWAGQRSVYQDLFAVGGVRRLRGNLQFNENLSWLLLSSAGGIFWFCLHGCWMWGNKWCERLCRTQSIGAEKHLCQDRSHMIGISSLTPRYMRELLRGARNGIDTARRLKSDVSGVLWWERKSL